MSGLDKFLKAAGKIKKEAAVKPGKSETEKKVPKGMNPDLLEEPAAIEPGLKTEKEQAKEIKNASAAIIAAVELEMAKRYQRIRNAGVK